jgi:hypothetical protein
VAGNEMLDKVALMGAIKQLGQKPHFHPMKFKTARSLS